MMLINLFIPFIQNSLMLNDNSTATGEIPVQLWTSFSTAKFARVLVSMGLTH